MRTRTEPTLPGGNGATQRGSKGVASFCRISSPCTGPADLRPPRATPYIGASGPKTKTGSEVVENSVRSQLSARIGMKRARSDAAAGTRNDGKRQQGGDSRRPGQQTARFASASDPCSAAQTRDANADQRVDPEGLELERQQTPSPTFCRTATRPKARIVHSGRSKRSCTASFREDRSVSRTSEVIPIE